jgi:hypothetical protein
MMRKLKGRMKTVTPGQYCEIFLLKKIKNVVGNIALVLFLLFFNEGPFIQSRKARRQKTQSQSYIKTPKA